MKSNLFFATIFCIVCFPFFSKADGFSQCVNQALNASIAQGAPKPEAIAAVSGIEKADLEIIALSKVQPESKLPIWAYLWTLLDDARIEDGRARFGENLAFLKDQEAKTGVDAATIAGIWGIETNFGKIIGKRKVINALATMACGANSRRAAFFKKELIAAIKIEAKGHVSHDEFVGSWAGAFGQTQFMPTTFWSIAIDGNKDGKINLISQTDDALASTANYLKRAGWKANIPWGFEVNLPKNHNLTSSRKNKKPLSYWISMGVTPLNSGLSTDLGANYGLIMPAGKNGPAFLVSKNFDAVYSYNGAISYTLAVNLLADAIKNKNILQTPWPTNDRQITRAQKIEIQSILKQFGYEISDLDGIIGMKSQNAIKDLYAKNGLYWDNIIGENLYNNVKSLSANMK